MTVPELLAAWDSGDSIWTVEMGGLGSGYEQAIQLLVVELLRDLYAAPLPEPKSPEAKVWGDATAHRLDATCGGFSGAQVGAAKQVAYRILRDGYKAALESAPQDRLIQISNFWPRTPSADAAVG